MKIYFVYRRFLENTYIPFHFFLNKEEAQNVVNELNKRLGASQNPMAYLKEHEIKDIEMSKWISVEESLPEKDDRYLVVEDHFSKWIGICKFVENKFELNVTHWMPLPSPPKER